MDFSNHAHDDGEDGFLTEQKESHWQPALRPNDHQLLEQTQQDEPAAGEPPSKMSFSHDDDDRADEETQARLDPAWGIKRSDSAHLFLDGVHRSASFPAPDLQSLPSSPHRTAEAEAPAAPATAHEIEHSFSQTKPDTEDEQETLHGAHDSEPMLQEEIQPSPQDEEDRSRYDEGVPLIASQREEQPASHPTSEKPAKSFAFDNASGDAGDDAFFSQVADDSDPVPGQRPEMERKDTSDVLNGLGMRDAVPDSPVLLERVPTNPVHQQQPAKGKDFASAFADETTDKDLAAVFGQTQAPEDDPWKAVMDDDDDFLIEDADDLLPDSDEELDAPPAPLPSQQPAGSNLSQQARTVSRSNSTSYAPHQPTTSELTQFGMTPKNGNLGHPTRNAMGAFQPSQQQPNITSRAESFVDQSKGGYKSPYDLPMDLAPKKRVQAQRIVPPTTAVPPPPRSSSMNADKQLQSPFSPSAPPFNQPVSASPAAVAAAMSPPIDRSASVPVKPAQAPEKRTSSGFFEELPIVPKTRIAAPQRKSSMQTPPGPPRQAPPPTAGMVASPQQIQQKPVLQQPQQDPYAQFQLRPPEKLDLFANVPAQPSQTPLAPAPPMLNSRYSPAPPAGPNGARVPSAPRYSPAPPLQPNGPRYSPAPPAQATGHSRYVSQPVSGAALPFQPRTSSPLAQHRRSVDDSAEQTQQRPASHHTTSSLPFNPSFPAGANTLSPPRSNDPIKQDVVPPRRSLTQSPSRQISRPGIPPKIAPPPNRPVSAFGQLSPTRTQPPQSLLSPPRIAPRPKAAEELDFIKPTDGTEFDPLERYKGCPVFRYGFGGSVVTSFPVRTPRFSAAATRPQIKASPGEVKIRQLETFFKLPEHVSKFPGPLKGKAKKKDVINWLASTISRVEQSMMSNPSKQLEEKCALWKITKILVEHNGNLENPQAVSAACATLLPDVYALENPTPAQFGSPDAPAGIYRPRSYTAKAEAVDPVAVEKVRKSLLQGKREDAVWQAVDSRLWSHAMLLASTLDKKVWKSVVSEFVKQEVKTIGVNSDSLCALYEVLGGNTEESIDQLVPPSARAGLRMVSTVDTAGPTRNALDGLDRWKETVCLILNNRTVEDQRALISLARLLTDYGRVEAGHICYLFARTIGIPQMFGGADDPNTMVALLGADHRNAPTTFHADTDSVLLTEVFEWAISALPTGATGLQMPHLAVYKLQRARELADAGFKIEAQAYCDAILSGPGRGTKLSPYYHPTLMNEVEELGNRLKQIPVQSASWMAKPSIEKVSGSVWNKFSSFVTGEDSDAESKGSARDGAEAGPFANVSGSPTLSRTGSQTDLYGSYPATLQMTPGGASTTAGSRYAPNGVTRTSSDMTRGRTSMEYQRSPPSSSYSNEPRNVYAPVLQSQQSPYSPLGMSPPVSSGYQPSPPYQPSSGQPMHSVAEEPQQSPHQNSYAPLSEMAAVEAPQQAPHMLPVQPAFGGYTPSSQPPLDLSPAPADEPSTLEPSTQSSFEPPSNGIGYGGYAPPEDAGYQPYVPEPDSDDDEKPKPKKKSFMDDDDDNFPRISKASAPSVPSPSSTDAAAAAAAARKKANDEAADAAFRAAAEADAQNAKQVNKKSSGSWLGGWFSGGKKSESLDAGAGKKDDGKTVHRVHLGEAKMKLYYDKEKKKWVNPDNPEASDKKTVAPPPRSSTGSAPPGPPPMAGPPRSVSTPHSLPFGGISRSGTPLSQAVDTASEGGDSRPGTGNGPPQGIAATLPPGTAQSLGLGTTPPATAGSGPPSRPASALSNASGLDDLLGGPPTGGRRVSGRQGAKGKKGRYVDVMAK